MPNDYANAVRVRVEGKAEGRMTDVAEGLAPM